MWFPLPLSLALRTVDCWMALWNNWGNSLSSNNKINNTFVFVWFFFVFFVCFLRLLFSQALLIQISIWSRPQRRVSSPLVWLASSQQETVTYKASGSFDWRLVPSLSSFLSTQCASWSAPRVLACLLSGFLTTSMQWSSGCVKAVGVIKVRPGSKELSTSK